MLLSLSTPIHLALATTVNMHSAADKRRAQSIAEDWHNASAVCIGILRKAQSGGGATLLVKETLKGDKKTIGTTLPIPLERHLAGIFPTDKDEKPALVFFSKAEGSTELQATEIYNDPDKIAATRCLSSTFDSSSEKEALQALSEMVQNPTGRCKATFKQDAKLLFRNEFLAAIAQMKNKDNFSIVTALYDKSDLDTKNVLLDWMACTGDRRALPYLIAAVPSPDRALRSTALTRLIYYYPGDVGVDACIEKAYEHGFADTKNSALDYVSKRRGKSPAKALSTQPKTPYQQAEELNDAGKYKEATALYIQEIVNNKKDGYVRRWSALKAIPHATAEQKNEIRKSILPLISEDASTGNYLEATDAADILQKLQHDDCLDSMIKLLDRRESLFSKANRMAAFGIAKLSSAARQKAAAHLIEQVKSAKFMHESDQQNQLIVLLELAWIGNPKELATVNQLLANSPAQAVWKSIQPLATARKDDGAVLIEVLKNNPSLPHLAKDWIIVELGELKDERAADLILAHLNDMKYQYDGYVADEALKAIGGKHVCQQLEKMAMSSDETSRNAVDILCAIEKENCLPALRKIIKSKSPARTNALSAMARLGKPDDLAVLIPLSDYWTGDRLYHYWTMEAIASIRQRFRYNVNGPIP
ncbi:MAG: HEAT repeat domain-containing protein [Cyanobacteria bacterium SZAS-4]|nr:HEAT repeat domain-containing protein [Cyanobacteria bacterium SZAS-4]